MLEKKGLHQAADILEKCGISSETDVSEVEQHDFSELESRGLKPLHSKKLKRWSEAVGARTNEMFPSSSTTQAAAALTITS